MMPRDVRGTDAGRTVRAFFEDLFRPGHGHVWTAQDLEAAPGGDTIYFIGQSFETDLDAGPSTSAWRLDATTGTMSKIAPGAHLLRVAPDGKRAAAFLRSGEASETLRLLCLPDGQPVEEHAVPGRVEAASWSPDGTTLLLLVAGAQADISGAEGGYALQAAAVGPDWLPEVTSSESGDRWRHLMLWQLGDEAPRLVGTPGINPWETAWLGNDRLLVVASDHHSEGSWYGASLRVLDLRGAELGRYRSSDQIGLPAGAPDGDRYAAVEAVCSDRGIVCGDVLIFDGAEAPVSLDLASVQVSDLRWRDERRLLYAGLREAETVVGEIDVLSGARRELWTSEALTIGGWYPHAAPFAADAAIAVLEAYDHPPAIARLAGGSAEILRNLAPPGGAAIAGRMEHLRWTGRDGLEITGWLLLPPGGSRDLPLLVDVHGGPIAAHRNRYAASQRANPVLAAQGCAVLLPNPRGSGGRGQDFARRVIGDMGGEDAHDILRGVDQLIASGLVDPDRVGIFGSSYGGFMSAMMLANHRRFAAAIPMSPVVNWYSQHFASQIPWFDELFLAASLRDAGGPYFDRSAVFALSGVTTPTLVIAGGRDKNTPTSQAVELFNALVEAGAPTALAVYPEDGHSLRGYPAYPDSAARILLWLEQHLDLSSRTSG